MSDKDGGQAFPVPAGNYSGNTSWCPSEGMSLRDYFAAQAMLGYLVSPITSREATDYAERCAEWAYLQADAMLKVREAGR